MPYLILQRNTGTGSGSIGQWLAGNISAASYDSKSFNTGAAIANTLYVYNGWWNNFGTKFYAATETNNNNYIVQYSASTPWDISTLTYDNKSVSVFGQTGGAVSWVQFSQDGTKMYASSTTTVYQYTLSTPYDVSTATYANKNSGAFSGSSYGGYNISKDGTKFYRGNYTGGVITEYNFGTQWDISTLSSSGNTFSSGQNIISLFVNPQGTKLYINTGSFVRQYTLGTAYNISTASFDNQIDYSGAIGGGALGMTFKYVDGTKMYLVRTNNATTYQFSI